MNESELSLGLEFGVWGVHSIEDGIVTLVKLMLRTLIMIELHVGTLVKSPTTKI